MVSQQTTANSGEADPPEPCDDEIRAEALANEKSPVQEPGFEKAILVADYFKPRNRFAR